MKKAIILPTSILILVCILAICFLGGGKPYEKKKRFSSIDEIVNVLNTSTLGVIDKDSQYNRLVYSDDFYECLSKRKRITDPSVSWKTVDLSIVEDFSEEDKKNIIDTYKHQVSNLQKYKLQDNVQAAYLKGTVVSAYDPYTTYQYEVKIIFIDEGEGLVIDGIYPKEYYEQNSYNKNMDMGEEWNAGN
ncbi:MAG: hypothetical protein PUE01_12745 [Clostridiaceae bacterium]|nr:hypothetical protein [Clostridiaceae bacterium]